MVNLTESKRIGKQIFSEFSEKNVTFMAAGIAYNAFISLAPLLLVLLLTVSLVGGGLEARIVELAQDSLPGPIADVIVEIFQGESGSSGASVVGLLVLIWGSLKIFRGLDTAFSEIYETTAENSFTDTLIDAFIVLVAIVIAIVATVGVTALFAMLSATIPFVGILTPIILVGGLIIAFAPMYYRFPDTDVDWLHVLPGTVFAAVGWAAFQALFQVYLAATGGDSESFFGGVVVIVTWLYFSGLVLLLGAVINAVLGGYSSGQAGGIGQSAMQDAPSRESRTERTLTPAEIDEYLETLRKDLTDDSENISSVGRIDETRHRSQPVSDIDVVERSKSRSEKDEQIWEVSFRWRTRPNESDDQP